MKTKILLLLPLAMLLAGCMSAIVPKTTMSGTVAGQPWAFSSPKDVDLSGLKVSAGTNGLISVEIQTLKSRMNPEVISTTAEGQSLLIKTAIDAGAAAAGKAAGAAAK